jgi:hypothetical protein
MDIRMRQKASSRRGYMNEFDDEIAWQEFLANFKMDLKDEQRS